MKRAFERALGLGAMGAGILASSACAARSNVGEFPATAFGGSVMELREQPSALDAAHSNDIQGVSHDAEHWYFSQAALGFRDRRREHQSYLWSHPVSQSLSEMAAARRLPNPWLSTPQGAYRHLGALSEHQGYLFVALAPGTSARPVPRPASGGIGVISASSVRRRSLDAGYLASFSVADVQGSDMPWVAADPRASVLCPESEGPCAILYSSRFGEPTSTLLSLETYRFTPRRGLEHLGSRPLPVRGGRIQGGVVSETGLLYLASDAERTCGIQVIEVDTLTFRGCIPLVLPSCSDIEVEGLTLWDLDRQRAPDAAGQLHVLVLDNDFLFGNDDVSMKHFRLSEP